MEVIGNYTGAGPAVLFRGGSQWLSTADRQEPGTNYPL